MRKYWFNGMGIDSLIIISKNLPKKIETRWSSFTELRNMSRELPNHRMDI